MNIPFSYTVIIIILNVVASLYAWNNQSVMQKWMMNPYSIDNRQEYWRFITSGFIHNDYTHLFFNMFTLFFFGGIVESEIGGNLFVILFILGIIISDIPTYLKNRKNQYYNSLGASGGVSSVLFASILFNPMNGIRIFPIPFEMKAFIFGFLYLFYSYYQAKRGGDNINHDAHFYGAVFGVVFSILAVPGAFAHFISEVSRWQLFN
ncbi:MAG: rhomboid family intramembrane serine protease [Bacteroidota bacterium]